MIAVAPPDEPVNDADVSRARAVDDEEATVRAAALAADVRRTVCSDADSANSNTPGAEASRQGSDAVEEYTTDTLSGENGGGGGGGAAASEAAAAVVAAGATEREVEDSAGEGAGPAVHRGAYHTLHRDFFQEPCLKQETKEAVKAAGGGDAAIGARMVNLWVLLVGSCDGMVGMCNRLL